MGIPEARTELLRIAERLDRLAHGNISAEIRAVIQTHMHRQRVKPMKARVSSPPITPALRDRIKRMVAAQGDLSTLDVANRFNVNPGRVSEVLAGKYD